MPTVIRHTKAHVLPQLPGSTFIVEKIPPPNSASRKVFLINWWHKSLGYMFKFFIVRCYGERPLIQDTLPPNH